MKNIIAFYTKSKSYDLLAMFYQVLGHPVNLPFVNLHFSLLVFLSTWIFVYLPFCLLAFLSTCLLSTCLFDYFPFCLLAFLSVYLPFCPYTTGQL